MKLEITHLEIIQLNLVLSVVNQVLLLFLNNTVTKILLAEVMKVQELHLIDARWNRFGELNTVNLSII